VPTCVALAHGPIVGCQFHPEKSGEVGLSIVDAFVHRL
jgi:imidazole glycerol-phosphate synthase subunit HisH